MKTALTPQNVADLVRKPSTVVHGPTPQAAKVYLAARLTPVTVAGAPELQMRALARALPDVGVAARLWRPWEDSLVEADCLHLFGIAEEFPSLIEAARRHGVKVVLSPFTWLGESHAASESLAAAAKYPLARKVTKWAGYVGRSVCPAWLSRRRSLYRSVDLLLPNSNIEAQQIMRQFQLPADRIQVVPHGVDSRFASASPAPFVERFGVRDFVLYAGPIEPRKNQLGFLWAMNGGDLPVVILGNAVPGYEWYLEECRSKAGPHVQFIEQFAHDDPMLESAYAACGCLVVASGLDAPERFALEAGMSGTPLVLFEGSSAGEYFGHQAVYVRSDDIPGIRRGVQAALARSRSKSLAKYVRTYFSWSASAKLMREAYAKALRAGRRH